SFRGTSPRATTPPVVAADSIMANESAESSAVLAEAWLDAVQKFDPGGDGAADHALVSTLLRMRPADFIASADTMAALIATDKFFPGEIAEAWLDRWLEIDSAGALQFFHDSDLLSRLNKEDAEQGDTWRRGEPALAGIFRALASREPGWTRM